MRVVCFFFSSRRRHTRFDCDWSSDVCSSDLNYSGVAGLSQLSVIWVRTPGLRPSQRSRNSFHSDSSWTGWDWPLKCARIRSEERRVGEEGRSRWAADHLKKKKKRIKELQEIN